jgi:hypothetical protein
MIPSLFNLQETTSALPFHRILRICGFAADDCVPCRRFILIGCLSRKRPAVGPGCWPQCAGWCCANFNTLDCLGWSYSSSVERAASCVLRGVRLGSCNGIIAGSRHFPRRRNTAGEKCSDRCIKAVDDKTTIPHGNSAVTLCFISPDSRPSRHKFLSG